MEESLLYLRHPKDPPGLGPLVLVSYNEKADSDSYARENYEVVAVVRHQEHGWDSEGRPL